MNLNLQFTKRGNIISLLAFLVCVCACSTAKSAVEDKPDIKEVTVVSPYSRIYAAVRDEGLFYSDTLSMASEAIITDGLLECGLPVQRIISVVGNANQEALDADYEWLKEIRLNKPGYIPPAMHAFLSVHSTRYAVLVYSEGFIWAKAPALYFLDEDYQRYDSRLYLCVVDTLTGKIVYYNRSEPESADPFAVVSVHKRIQTLLKNFNVKK
jgi:hypothetical protein